MPTSSPDMSEINATNLFDFTNTDASAWYIQDDGVMGGHSKGDVEVSDDVLIFEGTTVTKDGGFSSVLADVSLDLSSFSGVELHVRGGGRSFEFSLDDGTRDRGREVWRRAAFPTTDDWTWVRVPFSALGKTAHGETVDAPDLNAAGIQTIGFFIADGQDGKFRLEVDEVRGIK